MNLDSLFLLHREYLLHDTKILKIYKNGVGDFKAHQLLINRMDHSVIEEVPSLDLSKVETEEDLDKELYIQLLADS